MKKLFYLSFLLFLAACGEQGPTATIISENGTFSFNVEIADEPAELQKGLMYRKNLADESGMFFIFEKPQILNFWMKNTYIPLDIIFIDENLRIINIADNAEPCGDSRVDCPGYFSKSPAKYVLEISGGRAEELGIKAYDEVSIEGF